MAVKLSDKLRHKNRRLGLFFGFVSLWPVSVPLALMLVLLPPFFLLYALPHKEVSVEEAEQIGSDVLSDYLSERCSRTFNIEVSHVEEHFKEDLGLSAASELYYVISFNLIDILSSEISHRATQVSVYGKLDYILLTFPQLQIDGVPSECQQR